MYKIFEILEQVGGELPEGVILSTSRKVGKLGYENFGISSVSNNAEYLLTNRHYVDIPVNSKFNIIFSKNNPKDYININAVLKEAYIGRGEKVDILPENIHGECLLEFSGNKPELLNKLALWEEEYNPEINDFLYFTTQPVMDRILELLDE